MRVFLPGLKPTGVLLVSAALMAFGGGSDPGPTVPSRTPDATNRPNILLILTDDQGFHDVSYYGTGDLRTPHLDQLARQGMRFDQFYANCPVCSPTRAALLSGRYQDRVGVPGVIRTQPANSWGYLAPQAQLLPAVLKKAGYHTALIGKWHLGLESPNLPNERGFDYFHGWLGDMMDDYTTKRRHGINYMRRNGQTIDPQGHATDLFTRWSVDYLRERAKQPPTRPFFLYLAYNAPHFPVQPPREWLQKVKAREPGLNPTRAELVAFIEHLDDGIGQVLRALKETGQADNTLVIFTSDNGGHLPSLANNGPTRDGKQSMYEGGLRVPACLTWPGTIRPGSISDQVNLSMDLYPTLLDVAGLMPPGPVEGRSFLKTLRGEVMPESPRPLYFTRREGGADYAAQCSYALRLGDWKLVQNRPGIPLELYNLREDPLEKTDRIREQPQVASQLTDLLMLHIQESGRVPWQKPAQASTF
jgi:arylsulfatase A-like enzyme